MQHTDYCDISNADDSFRDRTALDIVWRRYRIDRRLRFLILDAIERVAGRKSVTNKARALPAPENGNSAALARETAEGIRTAGSDCESFFLHKMNIKPCDACDSCRKNIEDPCIIDDDMQVIYPKLRQADVLVIAGPVYYTTVSAQTKLFMDRCYALSVPVDSALAPGEIKKNPDVMNRAFELGKKLVDFE